MIDGVKHSFIAKFNTLEPEMYARFSTTLMHDVTRSRRERVRCLASPPRVRCCCCCCCMLLAAAAAHSCLMRAPALPAAEQPRPYTLCGQPAGPGRHPPDLRGAAGGCALPCAHLTPRAGGARALAAR